MDATNETRFALDLGIRGGRYQPLGGYQALSGGGAGYTRQANSAASNRAAVERVLEQAGFRPSQGGNWYSVEHSLQARICFDVPFVSAPAGTIIEGTIGVEIWDEPDAVLHLGGGCTCSEETPPERCRVHWSSVQPAGHSVTSPDTGRR